jgi:hypothetical protein
VSVPIVVYVLLAPGDRFPRKPIRITPRPADRIRAIDIARTGVAALDLVPHLDSLLAPAMRARVAVTTCGTVGPDAASTGGLPHADAPRRADDPADRARAATVDDRRRDAPAAALPGLHAGLRRGRDRPAAASPRAPRRLSA